MDEVQRTGDCGSVSYSIVKALDRRFSNCAPRRPGTPRNISKYSLFVQFMCIILSNGYEVFRT